MEQETTRRAEPTRRGRAEDSFLPKPLSTPHQRAAELTGAPRPWGAGALGDGAGLRRGGDEAGLRRGGGGAGIQPMRERRAAARGSGPEKRESAADLGALEGWERVRWRSLRVRRERAGEGGRRRRSGDAYYTDMEIGREI